jgi:hypothetical protein
MENLEYYWGPPNCHPLSLRKEKMVPSFHSSTNLRPRSPGTEPYLTLLYYMAMQVNFSPIPSISY